MKVQNGTQWAKRYCQYYKPCSRGEQIFFFVYLGVFFFLVCFRFFVFWESPGQYSGFSLGPVLRNYSWWSSGSHMECQKWNPGQPYERQMPSPLYYQSDLRTDFLVCSRILMLPIFSSLVSSLLSYYQHKSFAHNSLSGSLLSSLPLV